MNDVTSVSHHSPDTDMSGGDTEIFEVHFKNMCGPEGLHEKK